MVVLGRRWREMVIVDVGSPTITTNSFFFPTILINYFVDLIISEELEDYLYVFLFFFLLWCVAVAGLPVKFLSIFDVESILFTFQ